MSQPQLGKLITYSSIYKLSFIQYFTVFFFFHNACQVDGYFLYELSLLLVRSLHDCGVKGVKKNKSVLALPFLNFHLRICVVSMVMCKLVIYKILQLCSISNLPLKMKDASLQEFLMTLAYSLKYLQSISNYSLLQLCLFKLDMNSV